MKTSTCRDGTLKKPTKLDGNDTTTLSRHPYILCHFAAAYTNMRCVLEYELCILKSEQTWLRSLQLLCFWML